MNADHAEVLRKLRKNLMCLYASAEQTHAVGDALDAAIAALSVAQGQGWLPIESAPRDGTPIIVTDGERCAAVYWWPNVWMGTTHCGMKGPKFWQPAPPLPAAPAQPDGVRK